MDSDIVNQSVCKQEVNLETSNISLSNGGTLVINNDDSKHHITPAVREEGETHWNASTVICIPNSNFNHINTARKRKSSTIATPEKHKRKKTAEQLMKTVGRNRNKEDVTENSKLQNILPPSDIDTSDVSSDESFEKASDVIKYYLDKFTLQSHTERPTNSQNLNTSVEESRANSISKEPLTEYVGGRNRYSLRTIGKKPTVETSDMSDWSIGSNTDKNVSHRYEGRKRKSRKNERTRKPVVRETISPSSSLSDIEMLNDSDSSSNPTQRGRKRAGRKKLKQVAEAYKIPKSKYDRALAMLNSTENRFDETPANYTARTSCIVRKRCERRRFEEATHDNDKLGLFRPDSLARIVCALDTCLENEDWKLTAKLMVFGCGLVDHRVAKEEIVTSFLTHGMLSMLLDHKVDAATLKLFLLKIGKTKCKETDVDEFLKCVNNLVEREAIRRLPSY